MFDNFDLLNRHSARIVNFVMRTHLPLAVVLISVCVDAAIYEVRPPIRKKICLAVRTQDSGCSWTGPAASAMNLPAQKL